MFGTSGIRGPIGEEVTASTAIAVGRALASAGYETVVVGRDARDSGRVLRRALIAGLEECGADVIDLGLAATPTVARSVAWQDAAAGVSITASHNPAPDNGLKLWTPSGQAFDADRRQEITEQIDEEAYTFAAWNQLGKTTTYDRAARDHVTAIRETIPEPLACSVILDIGNGAGGVTATALETLGCDVETLNAQPDGAFPGRPSEPTAEHCTTLRATVANTDADLGIAHDGDADRMLAVDETGRFVSGDVLLALFAMHHAEPATRVAAPVNTSLLVDDALAARDVTITRTRVGDVYVAARTAADDVVFGGEPSGAWIWPDETLCPDGPLAACRLAQIVTQEGSLAELVDQIETYPIRRTSIETPAKDAVMDQVTTLVHDRYDSDAITTLDGVRVEYDDGWLLVRASGTQPLIRVTAEARTASRADELLQEATNLVDTARTRLD